MPGDDLVTPDRVAATDQVAAVEIVVRIHRRPALHLSRQPRVEVPVIAPTNLHQLGTVDTGSRHNRQTTAGSRATVKCVNVNNCTAMLWPSEAGRGTVAGSTCKSYPSAASMAPAKQLASRVGNCLLQRIVARRPEQ